MDKTQLLSPPPYEAPAYPRRRPSRVLRRGLLSVKVVLGFIITAAVLWLCFIVNRQTQTHHQNLDVSSAGLLRHFDEALAHCAALNKFAVRDDPQLRKSNSRWTEARGQNGTVVLRNATLFDGESFIPHPVDITFSKGLIVSVSKASNNDYSPDTVVHELHGRYVTPGLVDMHSHHMLGSWPATEMSEDGNEMNDATKAFTPFVRVLDGLKPYDLGTFLIASGGVTTSLIIPGSANLMGGEGTVVKNVMYSGEHGEPVIEDYLLERGIPVDERHRYMKMAYGENPKRVWEYTRMGNAWHLREFLQKAKLVREEQDDYCTAISQTRNWDHGSQAAFIKEKGKYPFKLELDSTIGVLRGRVIVQNHNYEPEDIETMLRISHEFGYRVAAFHHAIEAWQIPELLKEQGDNVTIATFAEFSLYKWEAYSPSLYAGHILDKHGVRVAYKSDHSAELTSAKYLASQAAVGHAFLLPEEKALQSITSIPAKAIDLDYRVGYARPGYDADLTIWNTHPLNIGATPLQVFIDGEPQLDQKKVEISMGTTFTTAETKQTLSHVKPQMRYEPEDEERLDVCSRSNEEGQSFIITGVQKAFVDNYPELAASLAEAADAPLDLVISSGKVICLGSSASCATHSNELKASGNAVEITLQNGHLLPGLTALTGGLGIQEVFMLPSTGDGEAKGQKISDPETLTYAKYGLFLDGKGFARARLGGVTRAITPPELMEEAFVQGVSVEILTSGKKNILNGGIVQEEVALHVLLGEATKATEGTVSNGIQHLRKALADGKGKNNATTYGRVADGELPLVVLANNKYDLQQLILIKKDFPETKVVVLGGKEAPYVAKELAAAEIPVILTENRGAPDSFRDKDVVVGPPLTPSIARYLTEAGVEFAVALHAWPMPQDFRIHDLAPEAAWTAMYAGLDEKETVRLVTTKVESILGLKTKSRDLVVYEGSPLQYGASVVLSFHADDATGQLEVATCFPREDQLVTTEL